ncbi:MAG: serine hydrolase [Planctomycetales bacterium]|nr:serine hydrolase [Planctomycetales bacterium]
MPRRRRLLIGRVHSGISIFVWLVATTFAYGEGTGERTGERPVVRELVEGAPEEVAIDAKRLALASSIIRHAVEDNEIPGAVVLVARRGRVVLQEAFGHRDFDRQQPLRADALFRMASNSKAVTAAGIMLLVDDGKLDLDAPVGKYLPAFDIQPWNQPPVTLRHLLTHTSGLRIPSLFLTPLLPKSDEHPEAPDLRLEVARFAAIGPQHPPGKTYSYNNAGYNILAAVIEQVAGSYQDHLRRRLYEPLGMRDSCNHESAADHSRMSTVMKRQEDGSWKAGWTPGDAPDWPFPRGSGGMVSTARDYALFCQLLLNQGVYDGRQILSEASVREMTRPQADRLSAATAYGLGWKVTEQGGVFSHTGSDGTYVWVDPATEVIGMVLTQTNGATRPRETFRQLVHWSCLDVTAASPLAEASRPADGFYKDLFMSGGKHLTSRKTLPAADALGLAYEYYAGADAARQNQLIIGNPADENGALLYPDGEPRFRLVYVNGGSATDHGKSLTQAGRERLRQHYRAGGSYCGSCAGSFLSGRNVDEAKAPRLGYLHLFPYNTLNTGIQKTKLRHVIPRDSALLRYREFGADFAVDDVYHNNGNWLRIDDDQPLPNVELLARYSHPGHKIDGGAAIWSYQRDGAAGRVVNIGCHPEASPEGEQLALTEACLLHAMDGVAAPELKAVLTLGEPRAMNRRSNDNEPDFARIGDRQYHHFAFDIPADAPPSQVTVRLDCDMPVDLHLFLARESLAIRREADYFDLRDGANKTFHRQLEPGRWHVSVHCATTVTTINDPDAGFHRHVGDRSVLNGVPYTISVQLD